MVSKQKSDQINVGKGKACIKITEVCKIILLLLQYVLDKVLLIFVDGVVVHNWHQIACNCTSPGKSLNS